MTSSYQRKTKHESHNKQYIVGHTCLIIQIHGQGPTTRHNEDLAKPHSGLTEEDA